MAQIGIGIVGGGYMGKAHSAAFSSVGTVFETALKPRLEMICGSTPGSGARYADAFGFARAASDWQELVADEKVQAVVIASPQATHLEIAKAAFALGKPVLCEKPMAISNEQAREMIAVDRTFFTEKHGTLDAVLKFSDVSREWVGLQRLSCCKRQC